MVLFQTEFWRSRGCIYLANINCLIASATLRGFASHFGQHLLFIPLFIFLGLLSWYLALPIQILKLSERCLYVWFIFPLILSPRESFTWDVARRLQGLPLGDFFNHVAASLLEKAWCEEAPSTWTGVY